jgi:hypothetical protein
LADGVAHLARTRVAASDARATGARIDSRTEVTIVAGKDVVDVLARCPDASVGRARVVVTAVRRAETLAAQLILLVTKKPRAPITAPNTLTTRAHVRYRAEETVVARALVVGVYAARCGITGVVGAQVIVVAVRRLTRLTSPRYARFDAVAEVRVAAVVGVVHHVAAAKRRVTGVVGASIVVVADKCGPRLTRAVLTGLLAVA